MSEKKTEDKPKNYKGWGIFLICWGLFIFIQLTNTAMLAGALCIGGGIYILARKNQK